MTFPPLPLSGESPWDTDLDSYLLALKDAGTATSALLVSHTSATTSAHGGLVSASDPRLSDARPMAVPSGAVDFGGQSAINGATPTSSTDFATKGYVDAHSGSGAVASVNGRTGTVVLVFSDVGAVSASDPRLSNARPMAIPGADVSFGTHRATNVADPVNPQDAATKAYVDAAISTAITNLKAQVAGVALKRSGVWDARPSGFPLVLWPGVTPAPTMGGSGMVAPDIWIDETT